MTELQEEVCATLSGMLANGEGISSEKDAGVMSMHKLMKNDTDRWLSEFFSKYSESSIQFTGIDAIFNDTDDILVQVRIHKVSLANSPRNFVKTDLFFYF